MKDKSSSNSAAHEPLAVSGPSESPTWDILKKCLAVDGIAVVVMVVLAFIFTNVDGVVSVLFGSVLVMAFFGLSLLVGHLVSKRMPDAVMGVFVLTYFVKVVGFAAILFALGTPSWLNKTWFAGAAVACVLIWQATEVVIFSKQRHLVFNDLPAPAAPVEKSVHDASNQDKFVPGPEDKDAPHEL